MRDVLLNTYIEAIQSDTSILDPFLQQGSFVVDDNNKLVIYRGTFSAVFHFISNTGQAYAIRCPLCDLKGMSLRYRVISERLDQINLPFLLRCNYISKGILADKAYPVILMEWFGGDNMQYFITKHLHNQELLNTVCDNFVRAVKCMHKYKIAHGDLQHGNILINDSGKLVLIDYDSMYMDELDCCDNDIVGLKGYQHHSRLNESNMSYKLDYFSELVIYITFKAVINKPELWHKYSCDNKISKDGLIFKSDDFANIETSPVFKEVSSISPELRRLIVLLKNYHNAMHYESLKPLELVIYK